MHWERYIKDFVSYLKIEKGLAENSILAYQPTISQPKKASLNK
jgi:site-specific recombinase XerD